MKTTQPPSCLVWDKKHQKECFVWTIPMNRPPPFLPQTFSAAFSLSSNDTKQVHVSLFLMGQQPFSSCPRHDFTMSVLSQNTRISFCKGVSIFSATSNGLEIMSPSTFLTAWLKLLGWCGVIFNAQVTLCFHFKDMCPQMALLTYSLSGSKGVEDKHRLSV